MPDAFPLRVLSYNIHKGVQGLGPTRRLEVHNLAAALSVLNADLIALQEVRLSNQREAGHFALWPAQGQAQALAPTGFHVLYHTNAVTQHGEHGNALLSRWPVVHSLHQDVSDHRFEQRGVLLAAVQHPLGVVYVAVVHLGLWPASRRRQVALLRALIAREVPPQAPLIVAGDFNEWQAWLPRALGASNLQVASAVATFPARWPVLALDHVFVRHLQPLHSHVPRGRTWWRLSDHLPLCVDCRWGGHAA